MTENEQRALIIRALFSHMGHHRMDDPEYLKAEALVTALRAQAKLPFMLRSEMREHSRRMARKPVF